MSGGKTALLVLLFSALVVLSCAPVVERRLTPMTMVEAIALPPADPLLARQLLIPVAGITREGLRDNFHDRRGKRPHNALDIMAKRGTPVLAVDDGRVARVYRHPL